MFTKENTAARFADIAELVNLCYPVNVKNGFWQNPIGNGYRFGLICGEAIGEALEADRKGKPRADRKNYAEALTRKNSGQLPAYIFEKFIKDTIEDELADAAVRIADTVGGLKLPVENVLSGQRYQEYEFTDGCNPVKNDLGELLMLFNLNVCIAWRNQTDATRAFYLGAALEVLYKISDLLGFSLDWHIREKVAYNATRAFMHGKKY